MPIPSDFYQAYDASLWQGRADAPPQSYYFQMIQPLDVRSIQHDSSKPAFALLGFSSDAGIKRNLGRVGAAEGPNAIRRQLSRFAVHRANFTLYDAGNVMCINDELEHAQQQLAAAVSLLLQHNITPIVLGGGHEIAYGHYLGLESHAHPDLAVVNFDAHLDMRPLLADEKGSSGTPFLQIYKRRQLKKLPFHYYCLGAQLHANTHALLQTAQECHVNIAWAHHLSQFSSEKSLECVDRIVEQHSEIYLSFCLDVMSSTVAPGVSAPQIAGLFPQQVLSMIRQFCVSEKILSYDLAELSPVHDVNHQTAAFAALVVNEIVHHHI